MIFLSKPSSGFEISCPSTIKLGGNTDGGYTFHKKMNEMDGKIKFIGHVLKISPVDPIECLSHAYLKGHVKTSFAEDMVHDI